jgi:hypothetical protein
VEYIIQFQYKGEGDLRPMDSALNDEEILAPDGKTVPIPNVGDSVTLTSGGQPKSYKVITRHFGYASNHCYINIVVTDISDKESAARLKE